jgi:hypothetical protein
MHMFRLLPCAIVLLSAFPAVLIAEKRIVLREAQREILIDGVVDEEWVRADSVSDFTQFDPYYNKPPSSPTSARLLTTPEALYCLFVCYQPGQSIETIASVHDQAAGDAVTLMLDTFDDKQTAYLFAVSAAGVEDDARLLDDARNRDYGWDGVWFSASRVYPWGYVVEIKIPYKSMRYNKDLTSWGIDFNRWVAAKTEQDCWGAYEQNEGLRISKFGRLVLNSARPTVHGLNLEVYPVGIAKSTLGKKGIDPDAGIDLFYNPSEQLTFQLTGNPDFAQIEADPFEFNISRYETYFSERRPFFTEGSEIFMASGRQSNSGFYRPMELFYSRRIGMQLPDGSQVPLVLGTKASGRAATWNYGAFYALTGETDYNDGGTQRTEPMAQFVSVRLKKQILDNSAAGILFVGKRAAGDVRGVLDIDGAFRTSSWQLAYQLARSIKNSEGDYAASTGFVMFGEKWINFARLRYVGKYFNVDEVGFVPWKGTLESVAISGPTWYYDTGYIRQILLYGGYALNYEDADLYTDHSAVMGFNMQLRDNWGYEINLSLGKNRDSGKEYTSYEATLSSWFNVSPRWDGNLWGGYSRTYNFSRDYLASYGWCGFYVGWKVLRIMEVGTTYNMYIEGNPAGHVEDITYNARPFFSFTPVNNVNVRVYVDNLYLTSSDHLERVIGGLLFSYNFLPKSWVYLALNEMRDRSEEIDAMGISRPARMHTTQRAGVMKVKYLYYL